LLINILFEFVIFFYLLELQSQRNQGKIFLFLFSFFCLFCIIFLIFFVFNNCMNVVVGIFFNMRTILLNYSWIYFFNFVVQIQLNV
jgi:hypothetical protein